MFQVARVANTNSMWSKGGGKNLGRKNRVIVSIIWRDFESFQRSTSRQSGHADVPRAKIFLQEVAHEILTWRFGRKFVWFPSNAQRGGWEEDFFVAGRVPAIPPTPNQGNIKQSNDKPMTTGLTSLSSTSHHNRITLTKGDYYTRGCLNFWPR